MCDAALQQGAKPARHLLPPALEAQPLSQRVDQCLYAYAVVRALAEGVCRRQDQIIDRLNLTGRPRKVRRTQIALRPACSLPLLFAPLRLLHATAFSAVSTHQQMMPGGCITVVN